ncbi:MAG: MBL fold metallo-hydrolase, partial [Rhizobiaceae bacterium]|nr:MBL fold metallo-hydrolase [Rhizobiaceae bacterium]
ETIERTSPDIVVTHSCGAKWNGDLIVMNAEETLDVVRLAPQSIVVATHMEALDHATVSRDDLRKAAEDQGVDPAKFLIPADGEVLTFAAARD